MTDLPTIESLNLVVTLPALTLMLGGVLLLLLDVFLPEERRTLTGWLALLGVVISLFLTVITFDQTGEAFDGMFRADQFTSFLNVIVLVTAAISILLAMDYFQRAGVFRSEYYFLLLFSTGGMMSRGRPWRS